MAAVDIAAPTVRGGDGLIPDRILIGLALLAVYLIWGSTYLALRIAVVDIPPFMLNAARFITAGGVMFAALRWNGAALPTRQQWRSGALVGGLMLGCGTGGVAFAGQWVQSGLAALAVAAVPIWTAIFAGLFGRWPNRLEATGLAIGLTGVALLNLEDGMQANALGSLALLFGPMCWSFGSILSRRVSLPSGLMAVAVEMLGGGTILLLASVITRENLAAVPSAGSIAALLYLTTFGSLIAFTAYMFLLRKVRPALATSYAYVNPVVAVALGVLLANEDISALGIIAMIVILSGVGLLAAGRGKQAAQKPA